MPAPVSTVATILTIVNQLITFAVSAHDSKSAAFSELTAFAQELQEFVELWRQTEDTVKLNRAVIDIALQKRFLSFAERINRILLELARKTQRFYVADTDTERRQYIEQGPLLALKCTRNGIERARLSRILVFLQGSSIRVQRSRLVSAKTSLTPWLLLMQTMRQTAQRTPSESDLNKILEAHRTHRHSRSRQRQIEHKAKQEHIAVSMWDEVLEVFARQESPISQWVRMYLPGIESDFAHHEAPNRDAHAHSRPTAPQTEPDRTRNGTHERNRQAETFGDELRRTQGERDRARQDNMYATDQWRRTYQAWEDSERRNEELSTQVQNLSEQVKELLAEVRQQRQHRAEMEQQLQDLQTQVRDLTNNAEGSGSQDRGTAPPRTAYLPQDEDLQQRYEELQQSHQQLRNNFEALRQSQTVREASGDVAREYTAGDMRPGRQSADQDPEARLGSGIHQSGRQRRSVNLRGRQGTEGLNERYIMEEPQERRRRIGPEGSRHSHARRLSRRAD